MSQTLPSTSSYCLKPGTQEDLEHLIAMIRQVALESENLDLHPDTLSAGIRHILNNPLLGSYWLLWETSRHQPEPVACMLTTVEWSDWNNAAYLWLQSVYILPAYRGQGLFERMLQQLEDHLEHETIGEVRLYVEKQNQRAIRAYEKCQFKPSHYTIMTRSWPRKADLDC